MATKSLDNQIEHYWPLLGKEEKQSILTFIKSFIKIKDAPQIAQRISLEQYNKEGHDAVARVKSGNFYTHEEVEEMSKKW